MKRHGRYFCIPFSYEYTKAFEGLIRPTIPKI